MALLDVLLVQDDLNIVLCDQNVNKFDEHFVDIPVKDDETIGWSTSLKNLPLFTTRDIEEHRELKRQG